MPSWLPVVVMCALALGCADNAELNVLLTVPPSTAYASVEIDARPDVTPWTETPGEAFEGWSWPGTEVYPTQTFELSDTAPTVIPTSIVAESVTGNVLLRLRFCFSDGPCTDVSPTLCFRFEAPFHQGARSYFRDRLEAFPPTGGSCVLRTVGRCEVGCAPDDDWIAGPGDLWCDGDVHVCDR